MPAFNLASFRSANFRQRVLSALVLAPVALLVVYIGGWVYVAAIMLVAGLALREWLIIAGLRKVWIAAAFPYLGSFAAAMLYMRSGMPRNYSHSCEPYNVLYDGKLLLYYLLTVVWATDIGAFIAGRMIGGPKLAPQISPGKTWAGLIGGMAMAGVFGYSFAKGAAAHKPLVAFIVALVLSVVSQMGDLFESWFKRCAGVKESGSLIPGHGGILDRIDGLVFAAIAFVLFLAVTESYSSWWWEHGAQGFDCIQ